MKNVECILYDFDGVMTDNRVYLCEDGKETVCVNRADGLAVDRIRELGIRQAIVSTERNKVVVRRAEKLRIDVLHGIRDKGEAVKEYCRLNSIDRSKTLFVGNDINDLSAFDVVGIKGCPSDASLEIINNADWIAESKGGYGVIRELFDWIIE